MSSPKSHIVVTTQTLFERWLRAHKDWWGDKVKNVPQQMAKALSDESFYTQAISNGSAVVKFSAAADRQARRRHVRLCDAGGADPIRNTGRRG